MNSSLRNILSVVLALAAFFLLYFVLIKNPIVSAIIAVAVFAAVFFIFQPKAKNEEKTDTALKNCEEKLYRIKALYIKLANEELLQKVTEVLNYSSQIIHNFKNDEDVNGALIRSLDYYMEILLKIISNYLKLTSQKVQTDEIRAFMQKMINSIDKIKKVFEKQLNESVEGDLLALDSELTVLNETLKLEEIE